MKIILPGDVIYNKERNKYFIVKRVEIHNNSIFIYPINKYYNEEEYYFIYSKYNEDKIKLYIRSDKIIEYIKDRVFFNISSICEDFCRMKYLCMCDYGCPNYNSDYNKNKSTLLLPGDICRVNIMRSNGKPSNTLLLDERSITGIRLTEEGKTLFSRYIDGGDKINSTKLSEIWSQLYTKWDSKFTYSSGITINYLPRYRYKLEKPGNYWDYNNTEEIKEIFTNKICNIRILDKKECNNCKINKL